MVTRSSSVVVKPWHLRLPTCTPEAEVASPPPRQAGKVSGGVSSLQFADELLARASYTPPLTAGGTRTRAEIMESVGVLKRNADLVDVVNGIQQTHLCFQEVASEAATYRPHLSRVLSKVMSGYARLFERFGCKFSAVKGHGGSPFYVVLPPRQGLLDSSPWFGL